MGEWQVEGTGLGTSLPSLHPWACCASNAVPALAVHPGSIFKGVFKLRCVLFLPSLPWGSREPALGLSLSAGFTFCPSRTWLEPGGPDSRIPGTLPCGPARGEGWGQLRVMGVADNNT